MSLLLKLPQIIEKSKEEYERILKTPDYQELVLTEMVGAAGSMRVCKNDESSHDDDGPTDMVNLLVNSDNLRFMSHLLKSKEMSGNIDLIYIDPPFYSKADYGTEIKIQSDKVKSIPIIKQTAYHDTWEHGMEDYLQMLAVRFLLMKELLSPTGSFFIHLDWHVVHYVKIILDEIFGEKNFINEIIWHYKSGGVSKRYFAKKHDTILFYAKTAAYYFEPQLEKSYNRGYKPYRFKGVKEYKDDLGWYTMVNMKDVWAIDMVGRTAGERTGYATQKPEALMERILTSCTKEGDIVADFFGGSGTLAAVAERMNRQWISCDIGKPASVKASKRLASLGAKYDFYEESEEKIKTGIDLAISVSYTPPDLTGNSSLIIELSDYSYRDIKTLPVDEKYRSIIKKIIKEDPISLIDYWSIDFHYDGSIYKPTCFFCRDNGNIDRRAEREGVDFRRVAVRVVDVFGNSVFKIFNLERVGE
jgi:site-specific DNA-methyltransferase (adenine-specific)